MASHRPATICLGASIYIFSLQHSERKIHHSLSGLFASQGRTRSSHLIDGSAVRVSIDMQTMQPLHTPARLLPQSLSFSPISHNTRLRAATVRRGRVIASATVAEDAKKLYNALETAALELRRAPPSLVSFQAEGRFTDFEKLINPWPRLNAY